MTVFKFTYICWRNLNWWLKWIVELHFRQQRERIFTARQRSGKGKVSPICLPVCSRGGGPMGLLPMIHCTSSYRDTHPLGHFQTCSTWTKLYSDPLFCQPVHVQTCSLWSTYGRWAIGILLECVFVSYINYISIISPLESAAYTHIFYLCYHNVPNFSF